MQLVAGDVLYVRIYPYVPLNEAATRPSIILRNVKIHGYSHTSHETGIDEITNDQLPITNKILRNGQLFILRDRKTYNVMGIEVK